MNRRSVWIILITIVGVAGLAVGIALALSLGQPDREPVEPTLAPIAAITTVTPAPSLAPIEVTSAQASSTNHPTEPIRAVAGETPVIPPTSSPAPTTAPYATHEVQDGQTLTTIALLYGVSIESIVAANNIGNPDFLNTGDMLLIPLLPGELDSVADDRPTPQASAAPTDAMPAEPAPPTPTMPLAPPATPSQDASATLPDWAPSAISGDLSVNYPLLAQTGSGALLLHYQPNTYPAANIETLAPAVDQIFARLQASMNGTVPQQVDVYLGGTLFGINPSLQGFTQSYEFRSFVLVNGAFHPGERDYILGHELAHVAATHILGPASSTMIHEGLATYLPQSYLTNDARYLPLDQICAAAYHTRAFRSASQLSQLSYGATAFGGHIRTFFNYNLSGCFVGYLVETYGMERLDQVYDSGNYSGVYGRSLNDLDEAWQATLENVTLALDAESFVSLVEEIAAAYETYINASAGGYHADYEAYLHLNRARLEVNRGNLDNARSQLNLYWTLSGS